MVMIMIMNLYSAKTIEEYSKALFIKLKLMNKEERSQILTALLKFTLFSLSTTVKTH